QTSPSGTSLSNSSATWVVSSSGTYYIRSHQPSTGLWGTGFGYVTVTVNPIPGTPTNGTGATREEPGSVTISATPGSQANNIRWYSAATGGTLLHTSSGAYSPTVTGNTTFYAASYTSTAGCESSTRLAVSVTVTPKPVINATTTHLLGLGTTTLLVSNNTYTTYTWKRGTTTVGTSSALVTDIPGTYTVTVTKSTMTGSGTSEPATIYAMPYVSSNTVRKEGITTESAVSSLAVGEHETMIRYAGGLGNSLQTIVQDVTPLQNNIVHAEKYDAHGRQLSQYLPYVNNSNNIQYRANALNNGGYTGSEQYVFYQSGQKVAVDTKPYTVGEIEASPLARPLKQTGVGNDWHSSQKKVTMEYRLNTAAEGIRIWNVNSSGLPVSTATYTDNQLYVSITKGENGNRTKTYTDKLGRTILTAVEADATNWLRTYHIYNDKGQLAYTLSPEGTKAGNYSPNQAFLDQWAFQYRYDELGRLVEYKTPAGGWIFTVYDKLNRPVLTQNADQRSRSEWSFVKYDVYGRAVVT